MTQHIGDLIVETDREVSAQVTGTTIVRRGCTLLSHGQLAGGLIIEAGGSAIVHGQVARNINNYGRLTLYGQVSGRVIGNLPINSMKPNQIVGEDLEVPFRGTTTSWASSY